MQRAEKLALLQQAITAGLDSGDAGTLDMQTAKQQGRAKETLNNYLRCQSCVKNRLKMLIYSL